MPHVIIKLYEGRSEADKQMLANAIAKTVVQTLKSSEASVSVAIEDVAPADWPDKVYKPDILDKPAQVFKKPGYNPFS
ncbi:MAG: tautomerase family protein [Caulobacterales bacterium]